MAVTKVSGTDLKLLQKNITIQSKPFCFEVAENSKLQFFLITQNDASISFPISSSSCFLEFFDEFVDGLAKQNKAFDFRRKEESLKIDDDKVLYFLSGRDQWGCLVKISEVLPCKYPLIVQSSSFKTGRNEGWKKFRDIIEDMSGTARVFFPPHKDICNRRNKPFGKLAEEKSEDQNFHNISSKQLVGESSEDKAIVYKFSQTMTADDKQFIFDLGINKGTDSLKVSEVDGNRRCSIEVPLNELHQFHEVLGDFRETISESKKFIEE